LIGINGPNWTADSRGVFHQLYRLVGVDSPPGWARHEFGNLSWWDWLSGPSIAMCVIIVLVVWTTSGTFMLMFLAGLQNFITLGRVFLDSLAGYALARCAFPAGRWSSGACSASSMSPARCCSSRGSSCSKS
jgi:hypothetical protein